MDSAHLHMIDVLRDTYRRLLANVPTTHRFLFETFEATGRLVGLVGPRGVGKTTLMLQYIREIHKYDGWEQELKNIHDSFPMVRVVFSGSSSLSLTRGGYDLSRRAAFYHLPGISFREYLNFATGANHPALPLDGLLREPVAASAKLAQIPRLAGYFRRYLREGYYPYVFEEGTHYYDKVRAVADKTIYEDVATYYRLKTENLHCFRKILYFLSTIPPGTLNAHKLGASLGVNDKTAMNYLMILHETGLIRMLFPAARGHVLIRKPQKTCLDNTTLYHAICDGIGQPVDTGTARELFFVTSAQNAGHAVAYSEQGGDFRIGDAVFEVGGRGKGSRQLPKANRRVYVVKDDILVGDKTTIPLYLLGFLY